MNANRHTDDINKMLHDRIKEEPYSVQQVMLDMMRLPTAAFGIDAETGTIAYANDKTERLFGISREEMIGRDPEKVMPSVFCSAIQQMLADMQRSTQPYMEIEVMVENMPSGTIYLRVFTLNQDQYEHPHFHFSVKDVTETRKAEKRLQNQYDLQQTLARISQNFNTASFDAAVNRGLQDIGIYSHADRAYLLLYNSTDQHIRKTYEWCADGIDSVLDDMQELPKAFFPSWGEKLRNHEIISIKNINDMPAEDSRGYELLKKHQVRSIMLWPLFLPDGPAGALAMVSTREEMILHEGDKTLLSVLADIVMAAMERQQAVQALMENHYRHLIEGLPDAVYLLNKDHTIHLMNPAGELLLEDLQKGGEEYNVCRLFEETKTGRVCPVQQVFETGMAVEREGALSGIEGVWHQRLIPIAEQGDDVDHVTLILRNITKEKHMSESLKRADKLATLGTLAAGVAHEINNPNNVITINIPIINAVWNDIQPLVRRAMEAGELPTLADIPTDEFLEEIPKLYEGMQQSAERIKSIVTRLKDYVRERPMDRVHIAINEVIADAETMVRSRLKQVKGEWIFDADEHLPLIAGDYQQLEQVFVNMLLNACDAIEETGGRVAVSTTFDKQDQKVVITVSDDGAGIRPEVLARIGDPFYTTKLDRGGTGLGVSISMRILEDHGGELSYASEPGTGTIATICLPVIDEEKKH